MASDMSRISTASLFKGTDIQEFDIHPDGDRAICSVNKGRNWELATLSLKTGRLTKFLATEQSLTHPRYSPSGDRMVFQTDFEGDENHDIVTIGPAGGRTKKVTDGVADNFYPELSPDGRHIAFLSNRQNDIENIYSIGSGGGKIRKLTHEELPVKDFAWSPNGQMIAYHTGVGDEDTVSAIDVNKGKSRLLLGKKNAEFGLAVAYGPSRPWSPDGNTILFCTNEDDPIDTIGQIDVRTGKRKYLVRTVPDKYQPQWSPDGKALAYLEVSDPNIVVKVRRGSSTKTMSPPDGFSRHVRWAPTGDKLYFINGCAVRQDEVYVAKASAKVLSNLHPDPLPRSRLTYPKLLRFRSFDGRKIPALLYVPKDQSRKAGIVMPHGGPEMQTINEWDQLVQMLMDRGFTVIEPNYRGSIGYGREFLHLHDKDHGGGDFLDTVYAGRYLVDAGYARGDRLGYWGASYSGFTCMLALTKFPDMWAAGVSIVGFFDWETEIATERGHLQAYDHKKMGDPKKDPEFFRKRSPIYFLKNLRAPLLMTASAHDVRCPPTESRAVVAKLRKMGKKCEYHEYSDEGHWPRKRKNLRDIYERSARFLDRHIAK
jgi:dipeptidyl aminopeptidase/acylaminoacyl peptidase